MRVATYSCKGSYICQALILATLTGGFHKICAADLNYSAAYSSEYDDNINRAPRNPESEWINALTVALNYQDTTAFANQRIATSASYRTYHRGSYPNDVSLQLDAFGEWFVESRTFSWVAADVYGQVLDNPTAADTPANRDRFNVLATGPNVYLNLSSVDTIALEGRYGHSWIENTNLDSTRSLFALRWLRRLSERSVLSLNYQFLGVDFTEDIHNVDNYGRQDGFIRGAIDTGPSQFQFDVGVTKIKFESGEPLDGSLARLSWTNRLNSVSSFALQLAHEYSDTAIELAPSGITSRPSARSGASSNLGGYQAYLTSQPFYVDRADLLVSSAILDTPVRFRLYTNNISYADSLQDTDERGASVEANFMISTTLGVVASANRRIQEFTEQRLENTDTEFSIGAVYRMSPRISTGLAWFQVQRDSSDLNGSYTDNRIVATLTYVGGSSASSLASSPTY